MGGLAFAKESTHSKQLRVEAARLFTRTQACRLVSCGEQYARIGVGKARAQALHGSRDALQKGRDTR